MPSTRTPTQIQQRAGQAPTSVVDGSALAFPIEESGGGGLDGLLALLSGLDDKYRRATTPSFGTPDTPGSGRSIDVDGEAVRLYGQFRPNGTQFPDPNGALLNLSQVPFLQTEISESPGAWGDGSGGWTGIWYDSPFRQTGDLQHFNKVSRSGPFLVDVNLNWFGGATASGANVLTKISPANTSAVLNPGNTGGNYVQAGTGDYFRLAAGTPQTAIRLYLDMVKVKFADDTVETYVITSIINDTTVAVTRITGGQDVPNWTADTAVQGIWLIQPNIVMGGSDLTTYSFGHPNNPMLCRPFILGWAPQVTDDVHNVETTSLPPLVISPAPYSILGFESKGSALEMGYPGEGASGAVVVGMYLGGTGAIQCNAGRQIFNVVSRNHGIYNVTGTGPVTFQIAPHDSTVTGPNTSQTPHNTLRIDGLTSPDTLDLTISLDLDNPKYIGHTGITPEHGRLGDELVLIVERTGTATGTLTVTWPGSFTFSGNDDQLPATGTFRVLYDLYYDGSRWLARRTDY